MHPTCFSFLLFVFFFFLWALKCNVTTFSHVVQADFVHSNRYRLENERIFIIARVCSAHATAISMCDCDRGQLLYMQATHTWWGLMVWSKHVSSSLFKIALGPFRLNHCTDPSLWCCVTILLALGHVVSPRGVYVWFSNCPLESVLWSILTVVHT